MDTDTCPPSGGVSVKSDSNHKSVRSPKPKWKRTVYPNTTMTTLLGYHLGEILYQGTRTLVYRSTRIRDNQPVVIKFLRNEYPSFSELVQFRNQYTIAKNLDLPGIVQPLALEIHGNGYALVMPDDGYISLGEWRQKEFSPCDLLTIAIQLAEILHSLYQNRVIHKDIKPTCMTALRWYCAEDGDV